MGRFSNARSDDGIESNVDISPLIDCVFILLIFFIVTTVFVEETGVQVDRPQAASASQLEKTSILIAISDKGEVVYAKRNIGVRGVQQAVRRILQQDPKTPVIIQADAVVQTDLLMRVIDEANLAGAERVSVATRT